MDVHKRVLEAYRKKILTKEQLAEIQQFKAKNQNPQAILEMVFQRGFLTQAQWEELAPPERSNKIQVEILTSQESPQPIHPQVFHQCLEVFSGGATDVFSLENTLFANRYWVKALLGEGGMGSVYAVEDQKLKREVALKIIKLGHQSLDARKRFLKEARAIAKLEHPHIVRIYEVDEDPQPYFTMEYVHGETLSVWIQKKGGTLSSKESAQIAKILAQALAYIHEKNIFHLDIKPSNILRMDSGELKLMDFGLAQELDLDRSKMSRIAGTPSYISPEQILGIASQINARTDIYLLGGTLYEMMTGQPPFKGGSANHIYYQVLSRDPLRPKQIRSEIHPDLEAICLKALEKEQSRRYETALKFAEDLEHFLEHRPVSAVRPNRWSALKKWIWRNKWMSAVSLLIMVLLIFFLGYLQWQKYQILQNQYEFAFQRATITLKKTQHFSETTDLTQHLQSFFQALNAINEALHRKPFYRSAEEKKWEIAQSFLEFCLKTQNYDTAEYLLQEVQSLHFLSESAKKEFQKMVTLAKTRQLREHLQILEHWTDRLQGKTGAERIQPGDREEFIFEVAQMKEKEVLQRLLEFLEAGKIYFVKSQRTALQDSFYATIPQILGRLGNPQASKSLQTALMDTYEVVVKDSEKNKDSAYIQWMAAITNALCQLKHEDSALLIYTLRNHPQLNTLFASSLSLHTYQKLVTAIIQKSAQSAKEYHMRGTARMDCLDWEGAIADFTQAILLAPENADAYNNRGLAWMKKEQYLEALCDFTEAIQRNPKFLGAYNNRGLVQLKRQEWDSAIEDFSQVLTIQPSFVFGWNNRGLAKYNKQDFLGAVEDYTQAILLNPQFIEAYLNRSITYFVLKQYPKALEDCTKVLELSPKNNTSQGYYLASVYYQRGNTKRELQDWNGALQDFTTSLEIDPNYVKSYQGRAWIKEEQKDWNGAIRDYSEAIRLDPQASYYYNRAVSYSQLEQFPEALQDYTQAIQIQPKYMESYHNRGVIKFHQGDYHGAIQDLTSAIQIQSNHADCYKNRGSAKVCISDFSGALEDYNTAIRLNSQDAETYFNRGFLYQEMKNFSGAIADWEHGLTLQFYPKISQELVTLLMRQAKIQITQKDYANAIDSLIRAKKYLSPQDPRIPQIDQKCQELTQHLPKKE